MGPAASRTAKSKQAEAEIVSLATKTSATHKRDITIPNRIETSIPAQIAKLAARTILAIR